MNIVKFLSNKLRAKGVMIILASVVGAYLTSMWPLFLSTVYDQSSRGFWPAGAYNLAAFAAVFLAAEVVVILCRLTTDRLIAKYEQHLRLVSLEKVMKLPASKLNGEVSGELTSRINQSISGASTLLKLFLKDLLSACLIGSFMIVQAVLNAPLVVAVIMLGYIACSISMSALQIRSQRGIRERIVMEKTSFDGALNQSIQHIDSIRLMDAEWCEMERMGPRAGAIKETETEHHTKMGIYDLLKQVIKVLFFVGLLALCLHMAGEGLMTGSMVITIALLFQQLLKPIDEVYRFMDELSSASIKSKKLFEILNLPDDEVFAIEDTRKSFGGKGIHINGLKVKNPCNEAVTLSQIPSAHIAAEGITSLEGRSGAGKSTACKGILRYFSTEGQVSVFGVPLHEVSQKQLAGLVCYLPQKSFFFAGTLRENLQYGVRATLSDAQLLKGLQNACIYDELVKKSRDVLSITLEEGAKNFSDGQRQRLALARVFLREPRLYILDEATANIDDATATKILDALEEKARTLSAGIVYIAHDQNVKDRCTRRILLDEPEDLDLIVKTKPHSERKAAS